MSHQKYVQIPRVFAFLLAGILLSFACSCTGPAKADAERDLLTEWRSLLVVPETPAILERKAQIYTLLTERLISAREKRFDISGTIVDEDGQSINDVRLVYSFSSHQGWDSTRFVKKGNEVVDGSFHFRGGPSMIASGAARKNGYYDESFSISGPTIQSLDHEILQGKAIQRYVVNIDDLTLVMVKQGRRTWLKRTAKDAGLVYRTDGSGTILDYARLGLRESNTRVVTDVVTEMINADPASMCIVVDHKYIDQNRELKPFAQKSLDYKGVRQADGTWHMPPEVRLIISDNEGGFIPFDYDPHMYEVSGGRKLWDRVGLQMRLAPEDGYRKEWVLTPELLKNPPFFYCRMNGTYGRGRIMAIEMSTDGRGVTLTVEIMIQPDGSRNLETGEW